MAVTQEDPRTRRRRSGAAVGLAVVALVVGIVAYAWPLEGDAEAPPTTTTTTAPSTTTTAVPPPQVPELARLATPTAGQIPTFDAPNGNPVGQFGTWYGYTMTSPILQERDGFFLVRLPERPNQSTAWVRATDVTTSTTDYRIVLDVGDTKVRVYKAGYEVMTLPAGFGKASTPTPLGRYFVAVLEKPGPHGYGPIVLDLSAHSEAIQSWQGAGDAIIALHGPFGSEARIGDTGTYISNGCIRLKTEDQLKLDVIPLGTPVDIVA